jgi:nucleosome binding factor SPN SPT16 subunit
MAGGKVLNTKTRGGNRQVPEQTTGEKIKAHQRQLHAERQAAGVEKYENGGGANSNGNEKTVKKVESYRREEQLPKSIDDLRIHVDEQRHSVILPVYGYAVPYHISTIKNVTKTDGADAMTLRINFQTPGQIAGKKEDMVRTAVYSLMSDTVPCRIEADTVSSHSPTQMQPLFDPRRSVPQTPDICSRCTSKSQE